jgi:hypothetical protein
LPKKPTRRLFLDDDPERASAFLEAHPDATWVQTVAECVEKLAEPWDEVHLDHDLGGEFFVDVSRDDCGMEVIRWLAKEPRRHLRKARFTVHSHNMVAAFEMSYRLQGLGYQVDTRPFGVEPPEPGPSDTTSSPGRLAWLRVRERARNLIRRARGLEPLPKPEPEPEPTEADPPDYVP